MSHNGDDPDIYYHRAQLHFILGEFAEAAKDYQKSIDLDRDFIFSHIQLGVTQYKMGSIASSMATFRRCIKNFDKVPDVYNYYGELLLDQQKYQEAIEKFDTAVEMEKQTKPLGMNVLPLINKALALFQWKQDFAEAEKLCQKALISMTPSKDLWMTSTNILQLIRNVILLLRPWHNSCCNKERSLRRSSISSVLPSSPERKARSSMPYHTPKPRGRNWKCKRNIRNSQAGFKE
jgi:hypothetical protein